MFGIGRKENDDAVFFGDAIVPIPKLTIEKWELLFENLETMPQIILNILSSRGDDNFTAKLVVGVGIALGEAVRLVSVITGLEEEFIRENADHNSLYDFFAKTIKKNDLNSALKKFRAALSQITSKAAAGRNQPYSNG